MPLQGSHSLTRFSCFFGLLKGRGLRCTVDNQRVLVGNAAWLRENDVAVPAEATEDSNGLASEGKTGVLGIEELRNGAEEQGASA